ncbi:MAG: hypothetical protein ACLQGV_13390 [Bryobacteraceae bacterium]
MPRQGLPDYVLSLPERVVRSAAALAVGLLREVGNVALPPRLRRTSLYRNLVEVGLRFLIEEVGQVEGVYAPQDQLASESVLRYAAGYGVAWAGLLTFHASPVWVMAALADLSGAGRGLISEISAALQQEGLLEPDSHFETIDQMLDGFERSAGRAAQTLNTPPLDVASLRREWAAVREEARSIPPRSLPSVDLIRRHWEALKQEAAAQNRPVFLLSSLLALAAIGRLPENLLWLSKCARLAARRTGQVFASALLDHYAATLREIHSTGYLTYWTREFRPYLLAAARQFSPRTGSLTGRLLRR